jgi:DNA helicase-2/ATP-dependent DNA helicase PcrA
MTQHGAKGLEWDRVYLTSVNNYDFPSADPFDRYRGEPYYSRDSLNTSAEAMAQLKALISGESYVEGQATIESRVDYAAERLRLLYVGITRARRELIISWNTGRGGDLRPARPLHMLKSAIESAS